ncbi:hypothetical protein DC3_40190 [Deinococcus cellulosilyticus NBRC 106333 = KACC 11606]|uniref:Uncharacterized protein n=1 Tax=Deinococcus cellulosilyticus (strain DSM 18568 / NBRC 106333 / KACC 11606 / 5516J-15) TaxID=1223518 RepID=A0A511N6B4_DEIC1|nr:hypothetical protein DC3_40190 [Deinococcus cellulosilyticus NBRC 106333 = KACC 11606]
MLYVRRVITFQADRESNPPPRWVQDQVWSSRAIQRHLTGLGGWCEVL